MTEPAQRFLFTGAIVLVCLVLAAVGLYAQDYAQPPSANSLLCDGKASPAGTVSSYTPLFSWQFTDADAGDQQTAFRIRVGTSAGTGDLWDFTGTSVTSTRMYGGSPLAANTTYYWSVQVWDRVPQPSSVASGIFTILDIGLRVFDGTSTIKIAADDDPQSSPLHIRKNAVTYGIVLVEPSAHGASRIRVRTTPGTKALKMMVAPAPVLSLSSGSRSFSGVSGGANPGAQTVSISNAGGGTLNGLSASISYGSGSGWLTASLDSATAPATLTVTPSLASLGAGTYTATISVASAAAANGTQTVSVTLTVAPPPAIQLSPTSVNFSGISGGANPGAQAVSISNAGGGTLSGLSASISYGSGSGWLTASLDSTTAPANLTVTASPTALGAGTYTAAVSIASAVAANSPRTVSVTLAVSSLVTFDSQGGSAASSQTVGYGGTITTPTAPTRTGYIFGGWYREPACTTVWTFAIDTVTANMTLYAKWSPISTYSVAYNGNGSTGGSAPTDSSAYQQGTSVVVLGSGTLVRTGYALAGWNTQSNGLGTSYAAGASFSMGTANVTLFAVWIPDNLTFTSSGTSITITGHTTDPTGSLAIPGGVTSLGVNAFTGCGGLSGVTIPSSVTNISYLAFQGCTGLTSITIPASVTSIGQEAFYYCTALTSITVDAANTNYKSISGVLFNKAGTTLLTAPGGITGSYTIPSGVTTIAMTAFEHCPYLTGVSITSSVTTIGWHAFRYCYALSSVTIPASVTAIAETPFLNCSSLTGINVDSANPNYKSVSGVLFNKSGTAIIEAPETMTGSYSIPAGVTSINEAAFMYSSLSSISIPEGVTAIGAYAFAWNSHPTALAIPSSVMLIGDYAFAGLSAMPSITIPSNVTSIGSQAFVGCTQLVSVTVQPATPPAMPSGADAFSYCASGLQIHVPSGSLAAYKTAAGWNEYSSIIVSP